MVVFVAMSSPPPPSPLLVSSSNSVDSSSSSSSSSPVSAPASLPAHLIPISDVSDPDLPDLISLFATEELRLSIELEFVSLLANPYYLHHLAVKGYLQQSAFLTYLHYLHSYLVNVDYLLLIDCPHSLLFLDLLCSSPSFRSACSSREYIDLLHTQQYWHWRSFRYNRYRQQVEQQEQQQESAERREGGEDQH